MRARRTTASAERHPPACAARPSAARALAALALAGALLPALAPATSPPPALPAAEAAPTARVALASAIGAGGNHSCALIASTGLRCWGFGGDGRLGHGDERTVGDDETPGSAGPVDLGAGRTATAIAPGGYHTCALLDDARVTCWGSGSYGALGYGNEADIGDDELPGSVGPVNLGGGRTARALTAGAGHTCALLDDYSVRCWGYNGDGRLGLGNRDSVGRSNTPGSVPPVDLGEGRSARAISAGDEHTCALLDDASVRCWGVGTGGRLGYGAGRVGDDEPPGAVAPVDLGAGRVPVAVSAGGRHTCVLLVGGKVLCWGAGASGVLGSGDRENVGDDEPPASVAPVDLGGGATARAIGSGDDHACALLDGGAVRCWGSSGSGQLGLGSLRTVGDDESPAAVPPVALGPGRTASAISAGGRHTCALLDDRSVRCWGAGATGQLGHCSQRNIGDDELPTAVGPVRLAPPQGGGPGCTAPVPPGPQPVQPDGATPAADPLAAGLVAQAVRLRGLRACRARAHEHARREGRRARRLSGLQAARVRRHMRSHRTRQLGRCAGRWTRAPGRVTGLGARGVSATSIALSFTAPGSDGASPPAARRYLVKQSRRPIRTARAFRRAQTLCAGSCAFAQTRVGASLTLLVTDLAPRTTYHYAVAARDNISCRLGPRSGTVGARTTPAPASPPSPPHPPGSDAAQRGVERCRVG